MRKDLKSPRTRTPGKGTTRKGGAFLPGLQEENAAPALATRALARPWAPSYQEALQRGPGCRRAPGTGQRRDKRSPRANEATPRGAHLLVVLDVPRRRVGERRRDVAAHAPLPPLPVGLQRPVGALHLVLQLPHLFCELRGHTETLSRGSGQRAVIRLRQHHGRQRDKNALFVRTSRRR